MKCYGAGRRRGRVLSAAAIVVAIAAPAFANTFTITPTFESSITNDPNAASIEATINDAIAVYEALFTNPINVPINFYEANSGLGESTKYVVFANYSTFYSAYAANAASNYDPAADTALSSGVVPDQTLNPVTNNLKLTVSIANLQALGLCSGCMGTGGFDGTIGLNTDITTPGSPGSNLNYYLMPVIEHEIDEVLGLGSELGDNQSMPAPEDLFRFSSQEGQRSYTTDGGSFAWFSVDGTNDLVQFNNPNSSGGGDWADWRSNPLPAGFAAEVQDAYATPGAHPSLGLNEITALQAIGYDTNPPTAPEPGSISLLAMGLVATGWFEWRRRRSGKRAGGGGETRTLDLRIMRPSL